MRDYQFHFAFVLHYRSYRDTSLLVELLTTNKGRTSVVARGAKRSKSPWKGLLQPFVPLQVHYGGSGELKTLYQVELSGLPLVLSGMGLWCGLYINELLMRVLCHSDACLNIFALYQQTIKGLHQGQSQHKLLRFFEKQLLSELGYALLIDKEMPSGNKIVENAHYRYLPTSGLSVINHCDITSPVIFSGKSLLAIAQNKLDDKHVLRDAKRLLRLALSPLLGDRPLNSSTLLS